MRRITALVPLLVTAALAVSACGSFTDTASQAPATVTVAETTHLLIQVVPTTVYADPSDRPTSTPYPYDEPSTGSAPATSPIPTREVLPAASGAFSVAFPLILDNFTELTTLPDNADSTDRATNGSFTRFADTAPSGSGATGRFVNLGSVFLSSDDGSYFCRTGDAACNRTEEYAIWIYTPVSSDPATALQAIAGTGCPYPVTAINGGPGIICEGSGDAGSSQMFLWSKGKVYRVFGLGHFAQEFTGSFRFTG